eukprot:2419898-Amphidinium_carterae.1
MLQRVVDQFPLPQKSQHGNCFFANNRSGAPVCSPAWSWQLPLPQKYRYPYELYPQKILLGMIWSCVCNKRVVSQRGCPHHILKQPSAQISYVQCALFVTLSTTNLFFFKVSVKVPRPRQQLAIGGVLRSWSKPAIGRKPWSALQAVVVCLSFATKEPNVVAAFRFVPYNK